MGTEHRDAFYGRGLALRSNGRPDLAAREFEQAIGVDPNHARSYAMLALCRCDAGAHDRAIDAAHTALTLDPSDGFVRRTMGWALLHALRPKEALPHALAAVAMEPSTYGSHALLGETYYCDNKNPEALVAADQAVRLRPDESGGHRLRANALRCLGRPEESRAAAETALRLEPNSFWSHVVLARVALAQRDARAAADAYRESLRLDPKSDEARRGLVLAIKMRNPAFRWASAFHSWFFAIPQWAWMLLLLGAIFLTAGIGGIVLITVFLVGRTVDPLANLSLRFDRYGRQLLTPEQIGSSDRLAALLLSVVAMVVAAACGAGAGAVLAAGYLGAWLPVAACARNCRPGGATTWMRCYAVALAASVAALGVLTHLAESAVPSPLGDGVVIYGPVVAMLFAVIGLLLGFSFARRCGYPWSHRFDAPSR
jgi:tetratricopeptide (TPR) repeat protein